MNYCKNLGSRDKRSSLFRNLARYHKYYIHSTKSSTFAPNYSRNIASSKKDHYALQKKEDHYVTSWEYSINLRLQAMSRRVLPSRRVDEGGSIPLVSSLQQKTRFSPLFTIGLVVVVAFVIIGYVYSGSGSSSEKDALSRVEGISCTVEVQRALPILKKVYGSSMRKVLYVGPEACSVVPILLEEEETEVWGVDPYDLEDPDGSCRSLVRKGIVRVADIKFPLPYRPKSFSIVIVSDSLDYLSPKYLNKTLPDLARVSSEGLVIFTGYPGQPRARVFELSKFGRQAKLRSYSWWIRYFILSGLDENQTASKKFEQAANKRSYRSSCQVFHINSSN